MVQRRQTPPPRGLVAAAVLPFLAAVALAALPRPALAHDWQGAATPDCECLPHFKLDCKDLKPVQKAWATLVSRRCNETLAQPAEQKVSLLKDGSSAAAGPAAASPTHGGGGGHSKMVEGDGAPVPPPVFRCQVDQACYEAYHVVIGHHYGCPPTFLPEQIASGVHFFQTPAPSTEADAPDTICSGCFQPRYVKKGAPLCPKLSCHGNEDYLLGNLTRAADDLGCAKDCSSDACRDAYQFLSVHHDGCVLNDNPLPARAGTDLLRRACAKHECAFSNGTYAAGTWKVDCAAEKNAGPFEAMSPAMAEEEAEGASGAHVAVDHSAHNHGAASAAPSNVPAAAAAASGAGEAAKAARGLASVASAVAAAAAAMLLLG